MVEFSLLDNSTQFAIQGLQAGLSPDVDSFGEAARLWEKYEEMGAFKVVEELDVNFLNNLVQGKVNNPMGALIASVILVRVGRTDKLPVQWLRNMYEWFPEFGDIPILLNEYLARQPASESDDEATRRVAFQNRIEGCLVTMHERGLPVIGEVLSYAIRQANNLSAVNPLLTYDSTQDTPIDYTWITLQQARQHFLPGGLFSVFAGKPAEMAELRKRWYTRSPIR